jgi:hypothetical protein
MQCVHAIVRCGAYHKICGSALLSLCSAAMIIKSRKEIIKSIAIVKLMNFYNRSTRTIKSMIIKKKTTTLSTLVPFNPPHKDIPLWFFHLELFSCHVGP